MGGFLVIHKLKIDDFILELLQREPLASKMNDADLDVGFVFKVLKRHYKDMGLYYVTKTQADLIRQDALNVINSSEEIRQESQRRARGRNIERIRKGYG
jgi:hypothetical protein